MPDPTITERLIDAFREVELRGVKQADLARRIGVSRATVNDWMKGRAVSIKPPHLFALADALGVEARRLATGRGPRQSQAISPDQRRLLEELHRLNDTERAAVRILVHQIAETRGEYTP